MKIGELNVGDLVTWKDPGAHPGRDSDAADTGIVLEVEPCITVKDRIARAVIYWCEEENPRHDCDGSELDDWYSRGVLEVVSERR